MRQSRHRIILTVGRTSSAHGLIFVIPHFPVGTYIVVLLLGSLWMGEAYMYKNIVYFQELISWVNYISNIFIQRILFFNATVSCFWCKMKLFVLNVCHALGFSMVLASIKWRDLWNLPYAKWTKRLPNLRFGHEEVAKLWYSTTLILFCRWNGWWFWNFTCCCELCSKCFQYVLWLRSSC